MKLAKAEDILMYELPTIAEYIWFDWGQELMARYIAWVTNRKLERYERRLLMRTFYSKRSEA